jgi:hypothetical protein
VSHASVTSSLARAVVATAVPRRPAMAVGLSKVGFRFGRSFCTLRRYAPDPCTSLLRHMLMSILPSGLVTVWGLAEAARNLLLILEPVEVSDFSDECAAGDGCDARYSG